MRALIDNVVRLRRTRVQDGIIVFSKDNIDIFCETHESFTHNF